MPQIAPTAAVVDELNARYGTQLSDKYEVVRWPYYDSQAYPMAGSTRLQFFQAVTTDFDQSNVEQAAAFPNPKKFFLRGLSAFLVGAVFPSVTSATLSDLASRVNDNHEVFTAGRFTLTIGNKQYLILAPLGKLPSDVMFHGYASNTVNQAMAADQVNYVANQTNGNGQKDAFLLDPPLLIDSQINFIATVEYTTAVAISAATRLFITFQGQMIRPAQ